MTVSGIGRSSGLTAAKIAANGCGGWLNQTTTWVCACSAPGLVANHADPQITISAHAPNATAVVGRGTVAAGAGRDRADGWCSLSCDTCRTLHAADGCPGCHS